MAHSRLLWCSQDSTAVLFLALLHFPLLLGHGCKFVTANPRAIIQLCKFLIPCGILNSISWLLWPRPLLTVTSLFSSALMCSRSSRVPPLLSLSTSSIAFVLQVPQKSPGLLLHYHVAFLADVRVINTFHESLRPVIMKHFFLLFF